MGTWIASRPDPIWIIFRRRTFSRLTYILLALGFDLRDRSASNLFYFVYFCAFWLAWCVAVFAMLGSALADFLEAFSANSSVALVVSFTAFILALWGLIELWQVTGRSPFVFSEQDAFLLCQTPVHRRSVGLAWFLMDWFGTFPPFGAGAILFSFALADISLSGIVSFQSFPTYLISSLRSLAIVLPLQIGLQAGLYGLGAMRLRRDRPPERLFRLRLTALPLGLGLLAAFFFPDWRVILLAPFSLPLQAAFNGAILPVGWAVGAGITLLILFIGMVGLLVWSDRIHLGRAAQETRQVSAIRSARSVMNYELVENIQRQRKMKVTRSPSQLPVRSGAWMLVWKNLVQSSRSLRARQVTRWGMVFILSTGAFLSPSWTVQLIMEGLWAVTLGSLITDQLRKDLARWWLLRSVPFQNSSLILSILGPAWGIGVLLGWLALVLTRPSFGWLLAALLPFLVACAALGSTHSILEHAKARILMTPALAEENVPQQDIQGVITILISVGLPLGLLTWSISHPGGLVFGLFSLPLSIVITMFLFQSVLSTYRWIS